MRRSICKELILPFVTDWLIQGRHEKWSKVVSVSILSPICLNSAQMTTNLVNIEANRGHNWDTTGWLAIMKQKRGKEGYLKRKKRDIVTDVRNLREKVRLRSIFLKEVKMSTANWKYLLMHEDVKWWLYKMRWCMCLSGATPVSESGLWIHWHGYWDFSWRASFCEQNLLSAAYASFFPNKTWNLRAVKFTGQKSPDEKKKSFLKIPFGCKPSNRNGEGKVSAFFQGSFSIN